jgi:hypothetical protein
MPRRVREPVQVYLDPQDRELLEVLAARTGLPRAEVLRRGLRQLADHVLTERAPGWSLDALAGALGDDPGLPTDLAARHDGYLYGEAGGRVASRSRRRGGSQGSRA